MLTFCTTYYFDVRNDEHTNTKSQAAVSVVTDGADCRAIDPNLSSKIINCLNVTVLMDLLSDTTIFKQQYRALWIFINLNI